MTETERNQIKGALLKCAKENENKSTLTGHIVVSSLCKSAVERIEELEKELNKDNEWHKVADGGDLPKNNTAVLVILKNKRMKISTFMENKFTIWNNDYDAYTKLYDVIAWCEVPTFEE